MQSNAQDLSVGTKKKSERLARAPRLWPWVAVVTFIAFAFVATILGARPNRQLTEDLAALETMGAPLQGPKPMDESQNAADEYKAVATLLLYPGAAAEAFKKLEQYDVYGVVKTYKFPTYGYRNGKRVNLYTDFPRYGPLHKRAVKSASAALRGLESAFRSCENPSWKRHCDFLDHEDYVPIRLQYRYLPASVTGTIMRMHLIKAAIDFDLGSNSEGVLAIRTASRVLRQVSGTAPDLNGRQYVLTNDALVRYLALAQRHNDKRILKPINDAAQSIGTPKSEFDRVAATFPEIWKDYQVAMEDPAEYLDRQSYAEEPGWFAKTNFGLKRGVGQAVHGWRTALEKMPKDRNDVDGIKKVLEDTKASLEQTWPVGRVIDLKLQPVIEGLARGRLRTLAEFRLLRTAIALHTHRAEKGEFPASLPKFGEDHIDPFTLKPLCYKRTKDGYTLYSCGENKLDDGGNLHNNRISGSYPQTDFIRYGWDTGIKYPM